MPIATRSMAKGSMAQSGEESPAKEPSATGKGKGRKPKHPKEPIASTSTAPVQAECPPPLPRQKPPPPVVSKKIAKSRQLAEVISISSEEDFDMKTEEAPNEKFVVPKSRPLRAKKGQTIEKMPPPASSTIKPKVPSSKKLTNIEVESESSSDEVGHLTRSSARVKSKKIIPEIREEVEPIPPTKTTKRNASKRVLEQRNEVEVDAEKSAKNLPKGVAKGKKGTAVSVTTDEIEGDLFEQVEIPMSKPVIQKSGLKVKGKKKVNQPRNVSAETEVIEQVKEEKPRSAMKLRNRGEQLIDQLNIQPGVFASQCRTIASVMFEPSAVRSMNLNINAFQSFRDDLTQSSEFVLNSFKAKKKAERETKKVNAQSVPEEVVNNDGSKTEIRASEDLFTSFTDGDGERTPYPPKKVVKRNSEENQPLHNKVGALIKHYSLLTDPVPAVSVYTKQSPIGKQVGVKRSRCDDEMEEQQRQPIGTVNIPLNFDFQASAEKENGTQATKKFLLDAGTSCQSGPSSSIDDDAIKQPPPASADATFVKVSYSKKSGETKNPGILNRTFDKDESTSSDDVVEDQDGNEINSASNEEGISVEEADQDVSMFEKSDMQIEVEEEVIVVENVPTIPHMKSIVKKPALNETVCVSNPKFPHLTSVSITDSSVPWPASGSILEVLEEEEDEVVGISNDKKTKVETVMKDKDLGPTTKISSSSNSSTASSTSSYKSCMTSQPHVNLKPITTKVTGSATKFNEIGKLKLDHNKKNALEREEEAKRKKAEILQQKQELQKKKNEEWKKRAEKMKLDEELKKTQKEVVMPKPKVAENKPVIRLPKLLAHPFSSKVMEPPAFKPSGPMKYRSPSAQPLQKPLFVAPSVTKGHGTPVRSVYKDESFKTPPSSFLDTTADMTINSYDITVYEDLDEDLKHRENKHIPSWAQNKQGISASLFQQVGYREYDIPEANFPKVQRGFKLYGGLHRSE